jgi:AraC family transcriptional regulator
MEPRIEFLPQKKLAGKSMEMSLTNDKTTELWSSVMPLVKTLKNSVNNDLFSIQIYDESSSFSNFTPQTTFTKWAATEVSNFNDIPDELATHTLTGGLYAVFIHKGKVEEFPKTSQYIFGEWLPKSDYVLDQREHFEVLGSKYKNNSSESEEEVWIPIRLKPLA